MADTSVPDYLQPIEEYGIPFEVTSTTCGLFYAFGCLPPRSVHQPGNKNRPARAVLIFSLWRSSVQCIRGSLLLPLRHHPNPARLWYPVF